MRNAASGGYNRGTIVTSSTSCFRASAALSSPPLPQSNICRREKATTAAKVIQAPQELCRSPAQRNHIDEHVTLTLRQAGSVLWRLAPARVSHRSPVQCQMASGITRPQSRRALSLAAPRASMTLLLRHRTFKTPPGLISCSPPFSYLRMLQNEVVLRSEAARLRWLLEIYIDVHLHTHTYILHMHAHNAHTQCGLCYRLRTRTFWVVAASAARRFAAQRFTCRFWCTGTHPYERNKYINNLE